MAYNSSSALEQKTQPLNHVQKLIADISAAVAGEERRRLIKRVEAGVARAQEQGKWTGRVPTGFRHDDEGYLQVLLDPDRENGEVGYLEVRRALERVTDGQSYRAVAHDMPNLTRQGLMKIDKDPAPDSSSISEPKPPTSAWMPLLKPSGRSRHDNKRHFDSRM